MIAVTEQPEFDETPIFAQVMGEHPVTLGTETPVPGTLPGDRDTHPSSAIGEHADGWPKEEDFALGGPTTAEVLASIEADYDEVYPSEVELSDALQAWLADRSETRPPLAVEAVIDIPDSFHEVPADDRVVPEKTVIIVPVGNPEVPVITAMPTPQTLVQITKP